ncbi:MAG: sporulation membrane protein YtaF [Brockia lithotrophica]|nr:sporulation membrane protein YtaF [Brockia lithotrophica]MBT9253856.1 sporulation membrane protein YtaF [Brockia lithotrophica]
MLLGFTFASSIDNYAVAITYGLRRVKIPLASNFLIAGVAFLFTAAGMSFGLFLKEVLPDLLPTVLGAAILGILGLRVVLLAWPRNRRTGKKNRGKGGPGIWPSLEGVFLAPESVDRDGKQVIGWGEAVLLGIALSANALTNGVSAGLFGLPVFLLSTLTALGSFVSVWLGVLSGKTVARVRVGPFTVGQFGTILSGALLLLIAFFALVD